MTKKFNTTNYRNKRKEARVEGEKRIQDLPEKTDSLSGSEYLALDDESLNVSQKYKISSIVPPAEQFGLYLTIEWDIAVQGDVFAISAATQATASTIYLILKNVDQTAETSITLDISDTTNTSRPINVQFLIDYTEYEAPYRAGADSGLAKVLFISYPDSKTIGFQLIGPRSFNFSRTSDNPPIKKLIKFKKRDFVLNRYNSPIYDIFGCIMQMQCISGRRQFTISKSNLTSLLTNRGSYKVRVVYFNFDGNPLSTSSVDTNAPVLYFFQGSDNKTIFFSRATDTTPKIGDYGIIGTDLNLAEGSKILYFCTDSANKFTCYYATYSPSTTYYFSDGLTSGSYSSDTYQAAIFLSGDAHI